MKTVKMLKLKTKTLETEIIEAEQGNTLKPMQEAVGGLITLATGYFPWLPDGVDAWVNDEGLLLDLPLLFWITNKTKEPICNLVGNMVFTRCNEAGETVSLTDSDIETIKSELDELPYYPWIDDEGDFNLAYVQKLDF